LTSKAYSYSKNKRWTNFWDTVWIDYAYNLHKRAFVVSLDNSDVQLSNALQKL